MMKKPPDLCCYTNGETYCKLLTPQLPVALHAVVSLRHETAAFLALYHINRHLFSAVLAFSS